MLSNASSEQDLTVFRNLKNNKRHATEILLRWRATDADISLNTTKLLLKLQMTMKTFNIIRYF